jgi:cytochrome c oxidase accessory protein FixG
VWTDLFMLVERRIEGDRAARIRLDRAPWTAGKLGRKLAKHIAWILISLATGGAWIFYFNDAPALAAALARFEAPSTPLLFIGLFTGTTYLLAGWAREQVCTYMCPWPRFQAAMMDEDSLIVTYRDWRGEGRGPRRKGETWEARLLRGGGDCIDCGQCVQVCPTGIDIRDGQQMECINCALCVDACNAMMARIGRPANLIAYDTLAGQTARAAGRRPRYRPLRPRTAVYGALLAVVAALMLGTFAARARLDISVQRDRAPLFVRLAEGGIRNGYTLKIANMTRQDRIYELVLEGPPGAGIAVLGQEHGPTTPRARLAAGADAVASYRVLVSARPDALDGASTPVRFVLTDTGTGETVGYDTVFLGPAR